MVIPSSLALFSGCVHHKPVVFLTPLMQHTSPWSLVWFNVSLRNTDVGPRCFPRSFSLVQHSNLPFGWGAVTVPNFKLVPPGQTAIVGSYALALPLSAQRGMHFVFLNASDQLHNTTGLGIVVVK